MPSFRVLTLMMISFGSYVNKHCTFASSKPGSEVDEIKGGVAGGSILRGVLRVNQFIEVRPGIVFKDENGTIKCTPIYSRVISLFAEQNELQFAMNFILLPRSVGVRTKGTERQWKVSKLAKGEILMLNTGSMSTGARVLAVKRVVAVENDLAVEKNLKVALSQRVEKNWRLIGWGEIQAGSTLEVPLCPI
ncbi:hypothetical protein MKX01_019216 [Papaver californicum]|nr:hypothetical protein MKX01_019216 [Papaver californicum]